MAQETTEEEEILALEELTPQQWEEIQTLAIDLARSGFLRRNTLHCMVPAFFSWLQNQTFNVALFVEYETEVKH